MSNVIKYLGIVVIISFCAVSVLLYSVEKDLPLHEKKSFLLTYSSFIEDRLLDFRIGLYGKKKNKENKIVLAEFNDESLKKIGRWPWTRTVWVKVLEKLKTFGARVVAFDVFFSEPERSRDGESPDTLLAKTFREFQQVPGNKILIPYSINVSGIPSESDFKEVPSSLYPFMLNAQSKGHTPPKNHSISQDVYPLEEITSSGVALGHIEAQADPDGIFRHYYLISRADGLHFPSFALEAYRSYTGEKVNIVLGPETQQDSLVTERGSFPMNRDGTIKVRWSGGIGDFPRLSIHELLEAKDHDSHYKNILDNALVFIGSTAFGAHDFRYTPVSTQLPGVYTQMNMAAMLLEGNAFKPRALSTQYSWYLLIFFSLVINLIQFFRNPICDIIAVTALSAGFFYLDANFFIPAGYEIRPFFCLLSLLGCYSWTTGLHFYRSNRDKRFLRTSFGAYLSPKLIEQMHASGQRPSLGGESGVRTALFTDIENFTALSEILSAKSLVELLNEYLTAMTDILLEERGTLDKYVGDAILAFFGAPVFFSDHARRACVTALRMQERLGELREKWSREEEKWPSPIHRMRMRLGLNTGEIVTGNMGSIKRMNYTMMGDAVNVAARLESLAKYYGTAIQVSSETKEKAGEGFCWRRVDTVLLAGKSRPTTIFELLGHGEELISRFHEGLDLYRERQFTRALGLFEKSLALEENKNNNPSLVYIERCRSFLKNPPEKNWDGLWVHREK